MKQPCFRALSIALLFGVLCSSSCIGPSGKTVEEQRASSLVMRDEALAAIYADQPRVKGKVEKSAGYAVFSNVSLHLGLLSLASGYGVVTNKTTGKETYEKWKRLTIGPGLAAKGLYSVIIFDDPKTVERFEKGPWVGGGQMEATFVFGNFGGGFEKAWAFNRNVEAYYTTHTGVALELELIGFGKVSNNSKLNAPTP